MKRIYTKSLFIIIVNLLLIINSFGQTATFTSASWTAKSDIDADGYRRSGILRLNISASTDLFATFKIQYVKDNGSIIVTYYTISGGSYIPGGSSYLDLEIGTSATGGELSYGIYDFFITMSNWSSGATLDQFMDTDDTDLNAEKFETAAEDFPVYCSGTTTLTSASGSFTDGSGSSWYGLNSDCRWLIQPTGATSITLNFSQFDTEEYYDFVTVYDGSTTSDPVLGYFSGPSIPGSVTSTGGSMLVRFTSDDSQCATGWSVNYTSCSIPAQPGTITASIPSPCPGNTVTYSISPVSGATDYSWALPVNWTGSSTTTSITTTALTTGGTVWVFANSACGTSTERTLPVTVSSVPSQPGPITPSIPSPCPGNTVTYSISPVSGATDYSWALPVNWTGSSTTTSITTTALTTGGTVWVFANSACGTSPGRTLPVTVSSVPSQPGAISGNSSVCQGSSQTYSISSVSGATFYTWTLPSGWSGSSTTTSITATPGSSGGTISVTANNSCGASTPRTFPISVTVVPGQPGPISGNTTICAGMSQTYSIAPVSGATSYTWSIPTGWSGTSATTSINVTPNTSSGSIYVYANNSCGSGTGRTLPVTVVSIPAQPGTITGSSSVCSGIAQVYSISPVSGATSYTWTLPSGWSGSSTTTNINATPGILGGTISVTANNLCGSSTARTLSVSVSSTLGTPGSISGSASVCQGSSQIFSVGSVAGATLYRWILPSGWSGTSTTNTINTIPGVTGGIISVIAKNPCDSSIASTLNVSVNPLVSQPGIITGNATVCQGTSQTYSISPVSGATSYTWTLPSGWTGSSTTTSITITAGSASGTVSVVANNSCGPGPARTLPVTVTPIPGQPGTITGTTTVCNTNIQVYSISAVSGATSYIWILPSGWSGSSSSTSISATPGSSGGNITVSAVNSCATGASRSLSVIRSAIPSQPGTISGIATVCQGVQQDYSITSVSGATSYTWTLPAGWTGTSTTNSISAIPGAAGGTISVKASNSCGSSTANTLSVTVAGIPSQPGTITGNNSVCQGSVQTYNISPVSGSTSYTWSLPSGWSGTSNSVTINITPGATSGSISVTADNACGSSTSKSLAIGVTPLLPQPGVISGSTSVCAGIAQTYSISSVSGATSYTWTLPGGWTGTSTSNSISITPSSSSGTISVAANNSCGPGIARTLNVTVTSIPTQPAPISGNASACQGIVNVYSVVPVSGATSYTWTLPSGWTGSSTTESISATTGITGGTISVLAKNLCGSSSTRTLTVSVSNVPGKPELITGNTTVCQGIQQTYTIPSVTGATSYNWTLPSGWTGSSSTTSLITIPGATSGTLSVTANNYCGTSASRTLSINVTPIPGQPDPIAGNNLVCQGIPQTYSITPVSNATSYTWNLPSGWIGTSLTTSITVIPGTLSGFISVVPENSCTSGTERKLYISISSVPLPPVGTAALSITQNSFEANWNPSSGATGYKLDISTDDGFTNFISTSFDGYDVSNVNSFIVTGLNPKTTYYYRIRAYNTVCTSTNSNTVSVTTLPEPPAAPTGLTAESCNDRIILSWNPNSESGLMKYIIYGGLTPNPITKIDSTTSGTIQTKDLTGLSHGKVYYIRITAVLFPGVEGTYSNELNVGVKEGYIPEIVLKWHDVLVCSNAKDSIATYQWYENTTSISGATKQYYISGKQPGIYKVEVTDLEGCKNFSNEITISGSKSLSLYPNPAKEIVTLSLNDDPVGKAVITVISNTGVKLFEFLTEKDNEELLSEIPVSNLDEGFYFIRVVVDGVYEYNSKIVVIK